MEALRAEAATTTRKDEDEKREAREAFASGFLDRWAGHASQQIQGPFVGGDTISVADLKLFVSLGSYTKGVYDYIPATVLDKYPKITGLLAAVAAHPRVAQWYTESAD